MKEFCLEEFESQEQYREFIKYMLVHSEFFSMVYFKHRENEPLKKNVKILRDSLKKYKIYSENTQEWPNTVTLDETNIYRIVFYLSKVECLDTLIQVKGLYEWDYPQAPMDLCFYKNGYCWLAITAHEEMAYIYTDNEEEVEELKSIGVRLCLENENGVPFYLKRTF